VAGVATIEDLRARVERVGTREQRALPIREDLAALFPLGGLARGSVVELDRPSVLFAVLSAAMAEGSWAVLCGAPSLGVVAAADQGVPLSRLVVVTIPEAQRQQTATVVGALLDAVDLVVVGEGLVSRAPDARRLQARARERGAVLLSLGGWPEGVDLRLSSSSPVFTGLGEGHGHLTGWACELRSEGRGAAARTRRVTFRVSVTSLPVDEVVRSDIDQRADHLRTDHPAGFELSDVSVMAPLVVQAG
jgi:hypothetical protein